MIVQLTQRGLTKGPAKAMEGDRALESQVEHWSYRSCWSQGEMARRWDREQSSAYKIFTQHVDFP